MQVNTFCRRQFFRRSLLAGTLLVPGGLFALRGLPVKLTFQITFPAGKSLMDYDREMPLWLDQPRFVSGVEMMRADGSLKNTTVDSLNPGERLVFSYWFADLRALNRFRDLITECSFNRATRESLGYQSDVSLSLG